MTRTSPPPLSSVLKELTLATPHGARNNGGLGLKVHHSVIPCRLGLLQDPLPRQHRNLLLS